MKQGTEVYARGFEAIDLGRPPTARAQGTLKITELGRRLATFAHHRLQGRPEIRLRAGDYRSISGSDGQRNELQLIAINRRREICR